MQWGVGGAWWSVVFGGGVGVPGGGTLRIGLLSGGMETERWRGLLRGLGSDAEHRGVLDGGGGYWEHSG